MFHTSQLRMLILRMANFLLKVRFKFAYVRFKICQTLIINCIGNENKKIFRENA